MKYLFLLLVASLALSGCSELELASHVAKTSKRPPQTQGRFKVGNPYKIDGTWYYPKEQYEFTETGIASWYGPGFHGKYTASGETFDTNELTAAHRTLQMPSLVRVTNLENGKSVIVRVNDRGPFARNRVIDLSSRAASLLEMKGRGTAKVRLDVLTQESLQIAQAAKSGINTKGYEIAANEGTYGVRGNATVVADLTPEPVPMDLPPVKVASVRQEVLETAPSPETGIKTAVPGHIKNGDFYPEPVVTEMPVRPTSIYVQAGAFSIQENADRLAKGLAGFGTTNVSSALVHGTQFYRVRIGPIGSVEAADGLLAKVVAQGNPNARIVVE